MNWGDYLDWRNMGFYDSLEPMDPIPLSEISEFIQTYPLSQNFWDFLSTQYPASLLSLVETSLPIDWSLILLLVPDDLYYQLLSRIPSNYEFSQELYSQENPPFDRFIALMSQKPSYFGYPTLLKIYQEVQNGNAYISQHFFNILEDAMINPLFITYLESKFPGHLGFIPDAMLRVLLADLSICQDFKKYLPSRIPNSSFMNFTSLCSSEPSLTVRSALAYLSTRPLNFEDYISDMYEFLSQFR